MDNNIIAYVIFYLLLDRIDLSSNLLVPIEYKKYLDMYERGGIINIHESDNGLNVFSSNDKSELLKQTMNNILSEFPSNTRISYGKVSEVIFSLGAKGNEFVDSKDKISIISFEGTNSDKLKVHDKLNDHIKLSIIQWNQIRKASDNANKISKKILEDMKEMENIKGQIYGEFIAILGVFSTLIFGLFGGFEGIKGILSLFKNATNFGVISMYCGLLILVIVTISFALIQFTGRLIGKSVKSCCSSDECNHKWFRKYKIYTICVGVSLGMILFGIIYDHFKLWFSSLLIIGLLVLPIIKKQTGES